MAPTVLEKLSIGTSAGWLFKRCGGEWGSGDVRQRVNGFNDTDQMNEVSVIIVSWNAKRFLHDCLHSISHGGGSEVREVIVVDNASSDGSPEMVEAEFPEVSLIRCEENLGFARANNIGIQRATGRWLALVNSDVVVHPGCFEHMVQYLEAHDDVGLVAPRIIGGDGELQRTCRHAPTLWNTLCRTLALDSVVPGLRVFSGCEMRHFNHDYETDVDVLCGCFWMARRDAVAKVGLLDERFFFYAEDVDWCKRFWDSGWRVTFLPGASATHFGGGSSSNAPLRYSIEMLRANLSYWRKHRGPAGQALFYMMSVAHCTLRFVSRSAMRLLVRSLDDQTLYKLERSRVCLRWLLTGRLA